MCEAEWRKGHFLFHLKCYSSSIVKYPKLASRCTSYCSHYFKTTSNWLAQSTSHFRIRSYYNSNSMAHAIGWFSYDYEVRFVSALQCCGCKLLYLLAGRSFNRFVFRSLNTSLCLNNLKWWWIVEYSAQRTTPTRNLPQSNRRASVCSSTRNRFKKQFSPQYCSSLHNSCSNPFYNIRVVLPFVRCSLHTPDLKQRVPERERTI